MEDNLPIFQGKFTEQELVDLNIRSPDQRKLLKLKTDKNTVFYFRNKEQRQRFIDRFYDREKREFIFINQTK